MILVKMFVLSLSMSYNTFLLLLLLDNVGNMIRFIKNN